MGTKKKVNTGGVVDEVTSQPVSKKAGKVLKNKLVSKVDANMLKIEKHMDEINSLLGSILSDVGDFVDDAESVAASALTQAKNKVK